MGRSVVGSIRARLIPSFGKHERHNATQDIALLCVCQWHEKSHVCSDPGIRVPIPERKPRRRRALEIVARDVWMSSVPIMSCYFDVPIKSALVPLKRILLVKRFELALDLRRKLGSWFARILHLHDRRNRLRSIEHRWDIGVCGNINHRLF